MENLAFRDATELADLIRARKISSCELLDHFVSRVERLDPKFKCDSYA